MSNTPKPEHTTGPSVFEELTAREEQVELLHVEITSLREENKRLREALSIAWHNNPTPGSDQYNKVITALRHE